MENEQIIISPVRSEYNKAYTQIIRYSVEVKHQGLNEYKVITAKTEAILQNTVQVYIAKLTQKWEQLKQKQKEADEKAAKLKEVELLTSEAIGKLQAVDNLLLYSLSVKHEVDWEDIKNQKDYSVPPSKEEFENKMASLTKPVPPTYQYYPPEPKIDSEKFTPKYSLLDRMLKSKREDKDLESQRLFKNAHDQWMVKRKEIDKRNATLKEQYEKETEQWEEARNELMKSYQIAVQRWESGRTIFYKKQQSYNEKVDKLKEYYFQKHPKAIIEFCKIVLNNSVYPDSFPKIFEIDYSPDTRILIVEYTLPPLEAFPTLNEVKYIPSKNEFKEYFIPQTTLTKMFDATMYKIALRVLYELFAADSANAVDAVSFNGWIHAVNRATGKTEHNCIMSIQVQKSLFQEIDLKNVDPKACFKNFKGVGSSKLSGITPIQPILQINRTDKRFIQAYDVADTIDNSTNLAAMAWEDFEHLIREIFEKEFSVNGGDVKITQASKDGGVDAIAFDPDPIRGGKIVIQAKRYTNTVGVSAVRDLYGTVMNEGATKGILVTTADYGPDAYEFVKSKPLTLMNGANLLYLLEKHGYHAKIDVKEAKRLLADKR